MMDALRDIQTLRGGEFMAACIDAVEQQAILLRRREEIAESRGQAMDLHNLRMAALLAAAAEMLIAVRADGEKSAAAGRAPVNAIDEVGRAQVLQFGLVVGERDGRWEVAQLLSAPSLAKGK